MDRTFESIGLPFPLFDAPIKDASEYCGLRTCSICKHDGRHGFTLGIGGFVMVDCSKCGATNGLDADDQDDGTCARCSFLIEFPGKSDDEFVACYECLRSGKAAMTKDTELGMVSWDHAIKGVTHGLPGLNHDDFEMVPTSDEWVAARVPSKLLFELLRTPSYPTWQGEVWLFCCQQPMTFVGVWDRNDFDAHAPDGNGQAMFHQVVDNTEPALWADDTRDIPATYVFRCSECKSHRANWDID